MKKGLLLLFLLFALVYMLPLGIRPLAIPDETRYGEIPREMISSGNWISPHLAGVRYFEKPVLGHWMNAVSLLVFGQNNFGVRFASAFSAGVAALLLFALVRKSAGYGPALVTTAVFITCLEVWAIGIFAVLDSHLALFTTGALVFFFFAYRETRAARRAMWLALCGVSCGLAFLTKGFLAFVVPAVTILPFLLWERRWRMILTMPWIPALAALLTALPWGLAIHNREPDFWKYFFWVEHVKRFLEPGGAQHPEPFWYFLPILAGGALPWTLFAPASAAGLRGSGGNPLVRYAVCWLVFPFLFFSASEGKLGTYILPCFPAAAILLGLGLARYLESGRRRLYMAAAIVAAVSAAAIGLALAAMQLIPAFAGIRQFTDSETWKWGLIVAGLAVWSAIVIMSLFSRIAMERFAMFCAAPVLFAVIIHAALPVVTFEEKAPAEFFALLRRASTEKTSRMGTAKNYPIIPDNAMVVSDDYVGPAVCWYLQRDDIYILGGGGELRYGLDQLDSMHKKLSAQHFADMVKDRNRTRKIVLIADRDRYNMVKDMLPPGRNHISYHGFEFAIY